MSILRHPQIDPYNTGSFLTTASIDLNTVTFTKGDGSTFPITVNTGSAYTVNNGLTEDPSKNFQLGGDLTKSTTVNTTKLGNYQMIFSGTPVSTNIVQIYGKNSDTSYGLYVDMPTSGKSYGIGVNVPQNTGIYVLSSGTGFDITQTGNSVLTFNPSLTGVQPILLFKHPNASINDGFSLDFYLGNAKRSAIKTLLTGAGGESKIVFETKPVSGIATSHSLELLGSGQTVLSRYGLGSFTGTIAYTLGVDSSGNVIETTIASTNTGSLLTTASVDSNVITFTKGDTSQFSITVNTGSGGTADISGFVTTSSFNAFTSSINQFTSSYNTGSFSGSFTGSFNGTASWATNAQTASSVIVTLSTDTNERLPLIVAYTGSTSGTKLMYIDNGLEYNTSTNALYVPSAGAYIVGNTTLQSAVATFGSATAQNHIVRITGSLNVSKSVNVDGTVTSGFGVNTVGFIGTASWAESASQALTSSYYQETDPIFTAKSASLATTGSNNFKGNQSITGSVTITGSLIVNDGTYDIISSTNEAIFNSNGSASISWGNRVLYASDGATTSLNWSSNLITTSPTFFTTTISAVSQEDFSSTSNYAGTVIRGSIDSSVVLYNVVYLETDGTWYQNNQGNTSSSKKLGIYLDNNLVLIEGHIVLDDNGTSGPDIQTPQLGVPIFIRDGNGTYMSTISPLSGYVRILGHIYYQNQNTDPNLYIMRFNPSNDYYLLG